VLCAPDSCPAGQEVDVRVFVFNDLDTAFSGKVTVSRPDDQTATAENVHVPAYGRTEVALELTMPDRPGRYELTATILGAGAKAVLSRRLVEVTKP